MGTRFFSPTERFRVIFIMLFIEVSEDRKKIGALVSMGVDEKPPLELNPSQMLRVAIFISSSLIIVKMEQFDLFLCNFVKLLTLF